MDLENLTGLIAASHALHTLPHRSDLTAAERSNARQALGIEIEERALTLVNDARAARQVNEVDEIAQTNGHVEHDDHEVEEPEVNLEGPFNPAKVRDAMLLYRDGFIIPELVAALDAPIVDVKKFVGIWAHDGKLEETGYKVGRHKQFRYVPPEPKVTPRPHETPVERTVPGVGADRRADGEAKAVSAMDKLKGNNRSKSGVAHHHRQRDKRHQRLVEAQQKRKK